MPQHIFVIRIEIVILVERTLMCSSSSSYNRIPHARHSFRRVGQRTYINLAPYRDGADRQDKSHGANLEVLRICRRAHVANRDDSR
jgi:hypothetical protein